MLKQYLRNHTEVKGVPGILGSSFCPPFQCRLASTPISSPGKPRSYLKFPWQWLFKVFIEFVTLLLLFNVLVFWLRGIFAPQTGMKPAQAALEGEVLTTGPLGKFPL